MWAALSANLRNLRNPTKRLLQTVIESDNAKAAAYAALSLAALLEVQGDNSGALRFRHALQIAFRVSPWGIALFLSAADSHWPRALASGSYG
jgi:hypothetical protein